MFLMFQIFWFTFHQEKELKRADAFEFHGIYPNHKLEVSNYSLITNEKDQTNEQQQKLGKQETNRGGPPGLLTQIVSPSKETVRDKFQTIEISEGLNT